MINKFQFKLIKQSSKTQARVGEITTPHGKIKTPCFMPIATAGAIRSLDFKTLSDLGADICLGNTYHLNLRPGDKIINQAGGLHKYIGWQKPILTDSGGYQVYSLAKRRRITPRGVEFQSHLDGSTHFLSPEKSIKIQQYLGSDIMMVLDECPPSTANYDYTKKSLDLTLKWASRCKKTHTNPRQALFGIVQGGLFEELRIKSSKETQKLDFDGYAIGGLAVGESHQDMYKVLKYTIPTLPEDKPRYLMGVGTPENIAEAIEIGVDMFDCVLPTRNARHGHLFTSEGIIRIKNNKYKNDFSSLDDQCKCYTCSNYTKSYLRHLITNKEPMSMCLNTLHNLTYYINYIANIRNRI
ncbi:tRNA guanosine(34) transglycosylase Tgt [Patescibacteria group bacterium]|nr:tRNA guanosine(34) transglycosylase Tgt [Patescibacteria group bacterium]